MFCVPIYHEGNRNLPISSKERYCRSQWLKLIFFWYECFKQISLSPTRETSRVVHLLCDSEKSCWEQPLPLFLFSQYHRDSKLGLPSVAENSEQKAKPFSFTIKPFWRICMPCLLQYSGHDEVRTHYHINILRRKMFDSHPVYSLKSLLFLEVWRKFFFLQNSFFLILNSFLDYIFLSLKFCHTKCSF